MQEISQNYLRDIGHLHASKLISLTIVRPSEVRKPALSHDVLPVSPVDWNCSQTVI